MLNYTNSRKWANTARTSLRVFSRLWLFTVLWLCAIAHTPAVAQEPPPLPFGFVYLKARFVYYAPDGTHLLVTLCEVKEGRCRPWQYHLAERRWQRVEVVNFDPEWSMDSATYSPDGKTIAVSVAKCSGNWRTLLCPLAEFKLALIDVETGIMRSLPAEQPRFKPSFTPDGGRLVYFGLDNVTLSGSGKAAYASHNLYMVDLDGKNSRKVIDVKTQYPLAPAKVMADGRTVTIAAIEAMGKISYKGKLLDYGMLGGPRFDSLLLGDLVTGEIHSLLPKGNPEKVVFDTSPDGQWLMFSENQWSLKQVELRDVTQQQVLRPTPSKRASTIEHGSYSPDGQSIAYVRGYWVTIGQLKGGADHQVLVPPTWRD